MAFKRVVHAEQGVVLLDEGGVVDERMRWAMVRKSMGDMKARVRGGDVDRSATQSWMHGNELLTTKVFNRPHPIISHNMITQLHWRGMYVTAIYSL